MERIDEAQVKHIAMLSRLSLTDGEVSRYAEQLSAILEYASHLPEFDATDTANPLNLPLRLAEDRAEPTKEPHKLLRNAVATENGYVKVPAILDKSDS